MGHHNSNNAGPRPAVLSRCLIIGAMGLLLEEPVVAQDVLSCERETIARSVSPDQTWVALVQEGMCTTGRVAVSTDTVRLERISEMKEIPLGARFEKAEYENDVLVVDYYGRPEARPIVNWLSPRKLQITIPNISGVGLQKNNYQDVEITIKYDPDDPLAREKWRKDRGLTPK